jgi:hypothetical protein
MNLPVTSLEAFLGMVRRASAQGSQMLPGSHALPLPACRLAGLLSPPKPNACFAAPILAGPGF